ncbi:MAG: hypothetical protein HOA30_08315 [Rhodospirillaceae bacterium]|jgi:hypothetical protein|nr:hypothetical protein [Rhodospirillaceae bacterium]MBT5299578.1 hypothetical protein [Rhodospirillaceae bacterium]MBT6218927.1 hypothetical protein [Rhodospirillaceae bacterium]MBT6827729.1 hypothetical protein [Rhodospirillales bacterium]MBT6884045.1 hypothetical protein [Rhodospirillaceae bacterium]
MSITFTEEYVHRYSSKGKCHSPPHRHHLNRATFGATPATPRTPPNIRQRHGAAVSIYHHRHIQIDAVPAAVAEQAEAVVVGHEVLERGGLHPATIADVCWSYLTGRYFQSRVTAVNSQEWTPS